MVGVIPNTISSGLLGVERLSSGTKTMSGRLEFVLNVIYNTIMWDGAVVAQEPHKLRVVGSSPTPATN